MKKIFLSLLLIISLSAVSQSLNFSDIVYLNPNETASLRPRICLVDGEPLVMFTRNSLGEKIFVNRKKDGEWLGENLISAEGVNFQAGTRLGPAIASYGEVVYVAYILDSSPKQIAFQRSVDGGLTFTESLMAYNLGSELAEGIDVLVLPDGNPVIAFIHYEAGWTAASQVVLRSYDGGETFTDLISIDNTPCECCTPSLIAGETTYGVSYRDNDDNIRTFKIQISSNENAEFTSSVETDPTNWEVSVCPASSSDGFIVGDTLYSTWMSKPGSLTEVYMSRTNLDEEIIIDWSVVDSDTDYGSQNHPKMDGDSETQVVVWEEYREAKKDIYGVVIQNGVYGPSFSVTEGDSVENKENVDVMYDKESNIFHLVYRNKGENAVAYRTMSPSSLSVEELDSNLLGLFPNPASDKIQLDMKLDGVSVFRVYSSIGEMVITDFYQDFISIESLQSGNYFIELTDDSKTYRSSFVKQ
jgi:hypothetical protein